ncbi:permease prefix domain 1-containing protein [Clostridium cellulovorans]|uniref:Uncharacterized protein n=1 Tax=Clostridium cellulovorans (strain ATCC 35296 / DSM 3052 / OCM 3 / 743B) TaxID=573061 RepID=D9SWJ9_CLOC7|nr:permease prefix domain 1-containing protein [Clostridium cellulovorans]ADL53281.1 hypothetical protein Clocel_3609 [Clostridium cellulovorans 743B]
MDSIDKYLNSIYKSTSDSSMETEDLKQEMRIHLVETAKELQENGFSEEESIRMAIERFGEEFQLRDEVNQVVKLQKIFSYKTLFASLILLVISLILFITSIFVQQDYRRRFDSMNAQTKEIEQKLINGGIIRVDAYMKELFKDESNNQLTYVAIKELPQNFDWNTSHETFAGEVKYSYPETIEDQYYWNRFGHEVTSNNIRYLLETGVKTSANTDNCSIYIGAGIFTFLLSWLLLIIWSIKNINRRGKLNASRCILLGLTGIIGYFIILKLTNDSNIVESRNNKIINIGVSCLIMIIVFLVICGLALLYIIQEPYRFHRLNQLIFG